MKRIIALVLLSALILTGCSGKPTWEEQYNLGIKYLYEGNYEKAVIAFMAAIEIEPKRQETYIALADTYIASGDLEAAVDVLRDALSCAENTEAAAEKMRQLEENTVQDDDTAVIAPDEQVGSIIDQETLHDGEYLVRVYGGSIVQTDTETAFYGEIREPIYFDEEYVSSLQAGDVIDLSGFKGHDCGTPDEIRIDSIERKQIEDEEVHVFYQIFVDDFLSYTLSQVYIEGTGYISSYILMPNYEAECTYIAGEVLLRITENTEFIDELSVNYGRPPFPNLQAYAQEYLDQPAGFEDLVITVENGQLTCVVAPFHP